MQPVAANIYTKMAVKPAEESQAAFVSRIHGITAEDQCEIES